jgi:hypothetical protein
LNNEYPKTFVAENGETLIAKDEIQAVAFKKHGLVELVEVEDKKKK